MGSRAIKMSIMAYMERVKFLSFSTCGCFGKTLLIIGYTLCCVIEIIIDLYTVLGGITFYPFFHSYLVIYTVTTDCNLISESYRLLFDWSDWLQINWYLNISHLLFLLSSVIGVPFSEKEKNKSNLYNWRAGNLPWWQMTSQFFLFS